MAAHSVEAHIAIAADVETVWAYRFDFMNLPAYNPDVSGIRREGVGVGAIYSFDLATPHGPHPVTLEVTDGVYSDGVGIVEARMHGAMSAFERFEVHGDGGAARASLWLTMELPDGLDEARAAGLLEGGRIQIVKELELIKVNLEA